MSGLGSRARQRRGAALPLTPGRVHTLMAPGRATPAPDASRRVRGLGQRPKAVSSQEQMHQF